MNLFDIMRSAGGGDPFGALAEQFGLSRDQVGRAIEALMPAFSAGLKHNAADPFGVMRLLQAMALGDYGRAYRNPAWAFTSGRRDSEEALAALFGSPDIARKAAELAAAYTGLTEEVLSKLQASLAAMLLGGLAEQSASANPMLDAMLKHMRTAPPPQEAPKRKGPLDRYEEEQERRERETSGVANLARAQGHVVDAGLEAMNAGVAAWQNAMQTMLKGSGATPPADAEATPSGAALFGDMLEPGVRLSEAYQREVEAMLARLSQR